MADNAQTPDAKPIKPDRMARLETIARLKEESLTIEAMVKCFCRAKHKDGEKNESGLCPDCEAFLAYAKKRLACCPYGSGKPVCAKCRIHCYKPAEKAAAREIMRFAGPRLVFSHPVLALKHLIYSRRPAPEKPRNPKSKAAKPVD